MLVPDSRKIGLADARVVEDRSGERIQGPLRVLLLDDDCSTLQLLAAFLTAPEVDLVACAEIEAAQCLIDRERFDVLVTDLEVSDLGGLEGIRLIRHVACNFPKTEVIVFSGKIDLDVQNLGETLGVLELLQKPNGLFRLRELIDARLPGGSEDPKCRTGKTKLVETLDQILQGHCITALLQPIISLGSANSTPTALGVEGLSRGPEGSPLRNPEILLSYAAKKEMLFETELQCIEAVLAESCQLSTCGRLFINTTPRSLSKSDFVSEMRDLVRRYGYRETNVVLELTEQQSILNLGAFEQTLNSLRACGFGLALDDYGSGFANLHLLQKLSLDYVKIDGRFCAGIHRDSRKQAIVRSTVDLAGELGISTIMERVETRDELDVVRDLGVDFAQGYFFSPPLAGNDLSAWFPPGAPIGSVAAVSVDLSAGSVGPSVADIPSTPWPNVGKASTLPLQSGE